MDIDLLGGLGGALFGIAAFPSVWKAVTTGSAVEVPAKTIWLFFMACLTYFAWLIIKFGVQWPFFFGICETVSWATIGYFHYFPRGWKGPEQEHWEAMGVGSSDKTTRDPAKGS